MNWKDTPNASIYLPSLNGAEIAWGIPTDLLARIACQESHFISSVVLGAQLSRAGCVGLMQLNPRYYPDAGKDWRADIVSAADLLKSDYHRFTDWQLAIASYNDGAGNVDMYVKGERPLPAETMTYVSQVVADVPVPGVIIPGVGDG